MSIAKPTFEKGELFFRQRDLERWIVEYLTTLPGAPPVDSLDSTAILKAMEAQHSILVERAQGIYSFSHLTFQEYLTARSLAENYGHGMTNILIRNHLTDQRWRELFLLTTNLLADADDFINSWRQATDGIIAASPSLIRLLTWATERVHQANVPDERRHIIRLAYISLARVLDRERALAIALEREQVRTVELDLVNVLSGDVGDVIEHSHSLSRMLALATVLASASSLTSAISIAYSQVCDLNRELPFKLMCTLAEEMTPILGFDYGLYYAWSYATFFAFEGLKRRAKDWQVAMQAFPRLVEGVATLGIKGERSDLAQQLIADTIPTSLDRRQVWQQYANVLSSILSDKRDIGRELTLNQVDSYKLDDYLYANELLVQCLKVAAVTDRQAVLNGLLLPPEARQEDQKTG